MRALTCTAPGTIEWCDLPAPTILEPTDVLVRPIAVARCEIDPFLVMAGPRGADRFLLGHEAVVEVVDAGSEVDIAIGSLGLPSFQVSCGTCARCRRGHTATCGSYPVLSDYGMEPLSGVEYGGMLSDLVRVPHAPTMLTPLPDGVDPVVAASVPDNVLDGYRAVAPHLTTRPGAHVLIACHALPSIGLYAALAAKALGTGQVTVASADPAVLTTAELIGALPLETDFRRASDTWEIVVDCGVEPYGFQWSVRSTEAEGVLHSVSSYLERDVPVPLRRLYTLGIELHIGRANSAALLPEVIALVADGSLRPELVTSQVIDWEAAVDHFLDPMVKLVVTRDPAVGR